MTGSKAAAGAAAVALPAPCDIPASIGLVRCPTRGIARQQPKHNNSAAKLAEIRSLWQRGRKKKTNKKQTKKKQNKKSFADPTPPKQRFFKREKKPQQKHNLKRGAIAGTSL
jgi:hypothetical protein